MLNFSLDALKDLKTQESNGEKYRIVGIVNYLEPWSIPFPFNMQPEGQATIRYMHFPLLSNMEDVIYVFFDAARLVREQSDESDESIKALTFVFLVCTQVCVFSRTFDFVTFCRTLFRCYQTRRELSFALDPFLKVYKGFEPEIEADLLEGDERNLRNLVDSIVSSSPPFLSFLLFQPDLDDAACKSMEKNFTDVLYKSWITFDTSHKLYVNYCTLKLDANSNLLLCIGKASFCCRLNHHQQWELPLDLSKHFLIQRPIWSQAIICISALSFQTLAMMTLPIMGFGRCFSTVICLATIRPGDTIAR